MRSIVTLALAALVMTKGAAYSQSVPIPYEAQRARMDAAAKTFLPYTYELKVPHLDPAKLSNALVDGTLNLPQNKKFAFVIAHRGYHSEPDSAEHSPTDIMEAYLAGSDAIELDTKMSQDRSLVLGHDFTMRREAINWAHAPVPSKWGPLMLFPQVDPFYADLSTGNAWSKQENSPDSDPENPKRNQMVARDMWAAQTVDNFDNLNGEHQMTLYEAMYFIAKYAPMQIWLDVKEWEDVEESARTIAQLRTDLKGDPSALRVVDKIFFKLTYGRIVNTERFAKGFDDSISNVLGVQGLYFFLVFNPADVTKLADIADGDSYKGYLRFCRPETGCVGAEYAYKYANAPQEGFQNTLLSHNQYMASFHNSPPYIWYQQTQQDDLDQASTWGRWYARADGSCCADRYDVLGLVGDAPEVDDLRPSAKFMEDGYQAITTDNAMEVLRDLQRDGRRSLVSNLATDATRGFPTGGAQISISRLFPLTERFRFELRGEAFDATNTPNLPRQTTTSRPATLVRSHPPSAVRPIPAFCDSLENPVSG